MEEQGRAQRGAVFDPEEVLQRVHRARGQWSGVCHVVTWSVRVTAVNCHMERIAWETALSKLTREVLEELRVKHAVVVDGFWAERDAECFRSGVAALRDQRRLRPNAVQFNTSKVRGICT